MFAVLIVPGLLLTGGYNRRRAHAVPRRDLYALAQAVVVSLAWLPVIWLLSGTHVVDWASEGALADHQAEVVGIVIVNLLAASLGGFVAGYVVDEIASHPHGLPARALGWIGVFSVPTAWDYAWLRASTAQWAAVEVTLKDDQVLNVVFDNGSFVGLSPSPREAFFDTEYRLVNDEIEVQDHEGIWIRADDIVSLRFEHLQVDSE